MDLKHITSGAVKPGENDKLIAHSDADKPWRDRSRELQPSLGSAFVSLAGCGFETD